MEVGCSDIFLNGCPVAKHIASPNAAVCACDWGFLAAEKQRARQESSPPSAQLSELRFRHPTPVSLPLLAPGLLSGYSFCTEWLFRLTAPDLSFLIQIFLLDLAFSSYTQNLLMSNEFCLWTSRGKGVTEEQRTAAGAILPTSPTQLVII